MEGNGRIYAMSNLAGDYKLVSNAHWEKVELTISNVTGLEPTLGGPAKASCTAKVFCGKQELPCCGRGQFYLTSFSMDKVELKLEKPGKYVSKNWMTGQEQMIITVLEPGKVQLWTGKCNATMAQKK